MNKLEWMGIEMDQLVLILLILSSLIHSCIFLSVLRRIKELERILDAQIFDYISVYSVVAELKKRMDSKFDLTE